MPAAPAPTRQPAAAPAPQAPLKVVIADDHPLFRRGLARTIHRHGGFATGAAGYVGKSAPQGEICRAIERVGRGGIAY